MRRRDAEVAVIVVLIVTGGILVAVFEPRLLSAPGASATAGSNSNSSLVTASASTRSETSVVLSSTEGAGNWTTYHADNARTGYYVDPDNFTSVSEAWTSQMLDGAVYAEPLVYGGDVFVATENNSVYALDAATGSIVWRTNLGPPVLGSQLQCGDINPSGITGTPVIDTSTGTLFVVAFSDLQHFLYGIDVQTGAVLSNRSAQPPGFVVTAQQQRSALSLDGGMVYIPYGGLAGDCGPYHGWVVALPANGTGAMDVYQVPSQREGGIWAPSGAAISSSGTVYVSDGNGASDKVFDHGDSVIALTPTLQELGYFAPTNWVQLNDNDLDLGSVGPSIVGPNLLFQIGKQGVGDLLNASDLGGIDGQLSSAEVCAGSYGGTAFAGSVLVVPCTNGLFALRIDGTTFSTVWHTSSFDAGPPIRTNGVVWSVDISTSVLYGFSATTGKQLYVFQLASVVHFCTPAAGDGRIFVGAGDAVTAFSLAAS